MKTFYLLTILLFSTVSNHLHALALPSPIKTSYITSSDKTKIAVQQWGNPSGKVILLSHAWSQHHIGWLPVLSNQKLLDKYHLVTYDLRGHGNSGKPKAKAFYDNGDVWADDLHAVISQLKLNDVTLVGWSYGTIIIGDYLQKYGEKNVRAVNMVAGLSGLKVERIGHYFGGGFKPVPVMGTDSTAASVGILDVVDIMVPTDLDKKTYSMLVASNMVVPPYVRAYMLKRKVDHKTTYENLTIPVLFTHGAQDDAVKVVAAEEGHRFVSNSRLSIYQAANHGPHWFEAERFANELDQLVSQQGYK